MRCPTCGQNNPDRAKFCLECGAPLAATAEPATETRRVVTIVFADMAGSTAIGERLDPEALRRVQARYFDAMAAVIEQHSGTVEKYIGDAVMAVFGIPRLHEDDPLRAVRAAEGMQRALDPLNDELRRDHGVEVRIRIGVNTGEVVAGDPAAGQRLVTGDTVNVAARLEQAAGAGEVLLGASTHRFVKDAVRVEPVEPLELKGKSERVPAYRLLEVLADTAGHVRNLDAPMVGRDKELEIQRQALRRVVDERTSHLFTLLGPAGVGKSRLVREFLAGTTDARILRGRCLSYGEGITYYAFAEIVRDVAGLAEGADTATVRSAVEALLEGVDDAATIAGALGGVLGWAEPAGSEDTAWAARKLFEHLARSQPLVLVIDDLHWAEPLLLDLVEHLADWTRDAPVLLLLIARPELLELRSGWGGGKLNATTILLEPLPGDAATELLDNLLGENDLPASARERILAAAEGNPLFVEEMVGMLIDDGLLRFDGQMWRAAEDLADLTVPPTIQLLLAARLDRLDAEERAVMERGAVEGKVFHTGAVTSLVPEGLRAQVRPRLLTLARKELIRPDRAEFAGEDAFRFRHMLIRDAAYQAMPKEQRAELHERFAEWLERASGERRDDYVEILGHHLEQAWRYRRELGVADEQTRSLGNRAAQAMRMSADRTMTRGDLPTATHLLERAAGSSNGETHDAARVELAELLLTQSRFVDAALPASALVEGTGDPAIRIRAQLVALSVREQTDPTWRYEESERLLLALRDEAARLGDQVVIDKCELSYARLRFLGGDSLTHRETALRLLPRVDRLSFLDRRDVAFGLLAAVAWGPVPIAEGIVSADEIERIHGGSLLGRSRAIFWRAMIHSMHDDADAYDASIAELDAIYGELGDPNLRYLNGQIRAECMWRLGRVDDAITWGLAVKAVYDEIGETGANSTMTALTAFYACHRGSLDLAEELLPDARAMTADDDFAALVPIGWVEARLASARGEHEHALAAVDMARALLVPTDYLMFEAETERVGGHVLFAAGRRREAGEAFDAALAMYERKGDVASAHRLSKERPDRA
ncbi:MAG: adenylate/guanylate cyclase domain-containing protein [Actinomycetota bacterium]